MDNQEVIIFPFMDPLKTPGSDPPPVLYHKRHMFTRVLADDLKERILLDISVRESPLRTLFESYTGIYIQELVFVSAQIKFRPHFD